MNQEITHLIAIQRSSLNTLYGRMTALQEEVIRLGGEDGNPTIREELRQTGEALTTAQGFLNQLEAAIGDAIS